MNEIIIRNSICKLLLNSELVLHSTGNLSLQLLFFVEKLIYGGLSHSIHKYLLIPRYISLAIESIVNYRDQSGPVFKSAIYLHTDTRADLVIDSIVNYRDLSVWSSYKVWYRSIIICGQSKYNLIMITAGSDPNAVKTLLGNYGWVE